VKEFLGCEIGIDYISVCRDSISWVLRAAGYGPINLDTAQSLQWQTDGHQVLRTRYSPTSTIVDERDHATCLPHLACPFAPSQHTPETPVASPESSTSHLGRRYKATSACIV
jgi:hypothetical protein